MGHALHVEGTHDRDVGMRSSLCPCALHERRSLTQLRLNAIKGTRDSGAFLHVQSEEKNMQSGRLRAHVTQITTSALFFLLLQAAGREEESRVCALPQPAAESRTHRSKAKQTRGADYDEDGGGSASSNSLNEAQRIVELHEGGGVNSS